MKRHLKLLRLIKGMNSETWFYTGCGDTPGLTYREPALVVTWTGGCHFIVAPREGPVLTKDFSDKSKAWRDGFVDAMCTDPVPIVMALIQDYKTVAAPAFA